MTSRWLTGVLAAALLVINACSSTSSSDRPSSDAPAARNGDAVSAARAEVDAGQYVAARDRLLSSNARPSDPAGRAERAYLLGEAYQGLNDHEHAVQWYQEAKVLAEPIDRNLAYHSLMSMAESESKVRRWVSAEQHLIQAIDLAPSSDARDEALLELAARAKTNGDTTRMRSYLDRISDRSDSRYVALAGPQAPKENREQPAGMAGQERREPGAPKILARKDWDPKPMKKGKDPAEPMSKPWRMTIHHGGEAEKTPPITLPESIKRMQGYQSAHQDGHHWADIGYHFVIDGAGRIWEGRELRYQGAHAGSPEANEGNIGICLMGNFDRYEPTREQKASLKSLVAYLMKSKKISITKVEPHDSVKKKNDLPGTKCPGIYLRRYIDQMKKELR